MEFILLKPAGADKSPAEINYWEGWMQREECSYLCDNCKWQEEHQWEHRAIAWISAGDQQHPHQIPSTSPRYLTRNYLEACVFLQTRNTYTKKQGQFQEGNSGFVFKLMDCNRFLVNNNKKICFMEVKVLMCTVKE